MTSGHRHLGFKSKFGDAKTELYRPSEADIRLGAGESEKKAWLRRTTAALAASGVGLIIVKGLVDADLKASLDEIGVAFAEKIDAADYKMMIRAFGFSPVEYPAPAQMEAAGAIDVLVEPIAGSYSEGNNVFLLLYYSSPSL